MERRRSSKLLFASLLLEAYMALYQHLRPTALAFGLGGDPECEKLSVVNS